jgi:general stress protein YciG
MGDKKRGFAAMDPEKQRLIASKGGKAAHAKGTAHQFTPEEARAAGRKGGQAAHAKGTAHQFTPEEAREAGRKGGQSSHRERPDHDQNFSGMDMPHSAQPDETRAGPEEAPAAPPAPPMHDPMRRAHHFPVGQPVP